MTNAQKITLQQARRILLNGFEDRIISGKDISQNPYPENCIEYKLWGMGNMKAKETLYEAIYSLPDSVFCA